MITIKKNGMSIQLQQTQALFDAQETAEGMYIKTKNGDELILSRGYLEQGVVRTIVNIIKSATAKNILIDFDNPTKPISFEN